MMTVLSTLITLSLLVIGLLFIAVSVQRAFTRTASLRSELRQGGPFYTIRYSAIEPAWPVASPLPNLRKAGERPARISFAPRKAELPQERPEAA